MYWLSGRTRNDLFLLYCFDDVGRETDELRAFIARRSSDIAELRVRLREVRGDMDYPSWVRCEFAAQQFVEHTLPQPDWSSVTAALGELVGTGVDAVQRPWRLHVFRAITGAPGYEDRGRALVTVLQISHALADGRRAAALARALFAQNPQPVAGVREEGGASVGRMSGGTPSMGALGLLRFPGDFAATVVRGFHAARARRQLGELTASGELPGPGPDFVPSIVNRTVLEGQQDHQVRMMVFAAAALRVPGRTLTVIALTAISLALARHLSDRGAPIDRLGAQVPVALPRPPSGRKTYPRNNFRSVGVDLLADEPDLRRRADGIAEALADRRQRAQHPLLSAQDRVTAGLPAPLLRRDVDRYPLETVPPKIAGHTVVSSVDRGPADLAFGGGTVRFTAGFPAIGSVMHLTHGIHGIGDTITVSLHADPVTVPDLDSYAVLLRAALLEVVSALE
ncbi:wax ester/triacylglycerol synthase family O-acyltransferase [Nocardia callitridis]|uniref:Wax ester/triacylglycerol synthase family O-acyltransferase n=2 Tax=Nocardia callitridis TaxID=648753 RepID=A0ABP9JXP7_9NOCA